MTKVIVFDLDGTLADERHRHHLYDQGLHEEYFMACMGDTPIQHIIDLTHKYKEEGFEIWIVTGRYYICEELTRKWLETHNVYYDHLKMRGKDNFMPDYVIKPAWVRKIIGLERVHLVYDDQDKVIEGFENKGLRVIDVKKTRGF